MALLLQSGPDRSGPHSKTWRNRSCFYEWKEIYFCTVKGTEYCVVSHIIFNSPVLLTDIVN